MVMASASGVRVIQKKWLIVGGVVALVLIVWFVYPRLARRSRAADSCREIATAAGVGDISVDSTRGIAYLAYLDRTPNAEGKRAVGTIMLVDLNAKEPRVRAALSSDPQNFRPLALSVYAPAEGPRRLFVIDGGDRVLAVQVFEQSSTGAFTLVKTLHDSRLANPVAIVASGPDQFYLVSKGPWWRLGAKSVTYFNGTTLTASSDDKASEIVKATSLAEREHADAAAEYGVRLLIGSVTDRKLLLCENAN
jgi:hypothetical protein